MTELFSKCVRWTGIDWVFADGWLISLLVFIVDMDDVDWSLVTDVVSLSRRWSRCLAVDCWLVSLLSPGAGCVVYDVVSLSRRCRRSLSGWCRVVESTLWMGL